MGCPILCRVGRERWEDEAARAATELSRIDRPRVRRVFEERFTARRMAEGYLNVYRRLIAQEQPLRQAI